jgi:hypothetical protein
VTSLIQKPVSPEVRAVIANCPPKDAQFLRDVIAIFCDPDRSDEAELVRDGTFSLQYNTITGETILFTLHDKIEQALKPGVN